MERSFAKLVGRGAKLMGIGAGVYGLWNVIDIVNYCLIGDRCEGWEVALSAAGGLVVLGISGWVQGDELVRD